MLSCRGGVCCAWHLLVIMHFEPRQYSKYEFKVIWCVAKDKSNTVQKSTVFKKGLKSSDKYKYPHNNNAFKENGKSTGIMVIL